MRGAGGVTSVSSTCTSTPACRTAGLFCLEFCIPLVHTTCTTGVTLKERELSGPGGPGSVHQCEVRGGGRATQSHSQAHVSVPLPQYPAGMDPAETPAPCPGMHQVQGSIVCKNQVQNLPTENQIHKTRSSVSRIRRQPFLTRTQAGQL